MSLSPGAAAAVERAGGAFRARFGRPHHWRGVAPGRINLIGEHTDYNDGFVLPIAIERHCVALGAPAADPGVSRLALPDAGEELACDLRRPPAPDGVRRGAATAYILGVCALMGARAPAGVANVDLLVSGTVPLGSGLSSSASLEVAVAGALERAWGVRLAPLDKALLCQRAEHEYAGVPCGIMDQFVSVMGRARHALLIDCRDRTSRHVPMPDGARVVVMNTGVHHALAAGEYARRRECCRAAALKLGVPSLREASLAGLGASATLSAEELACARHVVTENERVRRAVAALERGDLAAAGALMLESHASLRADYRVSCDELDTLVDLAAGVPGVHGARMTGGGFGGCAIALCTPAAVGALRERITQGYRARHGRECDLFETTAADGAAAIGA